MAARNTRREDMAFNRELSTLLHRRAVELGCYKGASPSQLPGKVQERLIQFLFALLQLPRETLETYYLSCERFEQELSRCTPAESIHFDSDGGVRGMSHRYQYFDATQRVRITIRSIKDDSTVYNGLGVIETVVSEFTRNGGYEWEGSGFSYDEVSATILLEQQKPPQ